LKILPELEAYRDRLMTKAAAWPDQAIADLRRELDQCVQQVALLGKAVSDLRERAAEWPGHAAGAGSAAAPDAPAERIAHRVAVQEQTRDITSAYAEALRRHIEGRPSNC